MKILILKASYSNYCNSVMPLLLHFNYWEKQNLPIIDIYKYHLSSLNEEFGEIAFSVLATANLKLNKNGFSQLTHFYTMLNCYNICNFVTLYS